MLSQTCPAWLRTTPAVPIAPVICLCLAAVMLPEPVSAEPRTMATRDSLVLCAPVAAPVMPARAVPGARQADRLVRRIGDGRFFAPTRAAMFFSHPGDRCAWQGGRALHS